MNDKLWETLFADAVIVFGSFLLVVEKLLKKPLSSDEIPNIVNERSISIYGFLLLILGLVINFYFTDKNNRQSVRDKFVSDSTQKVNASLTQRLVNIQHSLNIKQDSLNSKQETIISMQSSLALTADKQLDTAIEALRTERIVLTKNNAILKEQIAFGKTQQELLNQTTGGDTLVHLIPDYFTVAPDYKIKILLKNSSTRTQYDVRIEIIDSFKFQMAMNLRPKSVRPMTIYDRLERDRKLSRETGTDTSFEKIYPGDLKTIYSTNLPSELTDGFFRVKLISRNGSYEQEFIYKRYDDKGSLNFGGKPIFLWKLIAVKRL